MQFEWDDEKERINILKHKLTFSTAVRVFKDTKRVEWYDTRHSDYEDRYITVGMINGKPVIVTVVYTERKEIIRIISARAATKKEKEAYFYGKDSLY